MNRSVKDCIGDVFKRTLHRYIYVEILEAGKHKLLNFRFRRWRRYSGYNRASDRGLYFKNWSRKIELLEAEDIAYLMSLGRDDAKQCAWEIIASRGK